MKRGIVVVAFQEKSARRSALMPMLIPRGCDAANR
jgi:hypothetical protein